MTPGKNPALAKWPRWLAALDQTPDSVDRITSSAPRERVDRVALCVGEDSDERSRAMIILGCDFHARFQRCPALVFAWLLCSLYRAAEAVAAILRAVELVTSHSFTSAAPVTTDSRGFITALKPAR